MSVHTQGRLRVGDVYDGQWALIGTPLVKQYGKQCAVAVGIRNEADARRLVACWNACDGIATEVLEAIPGITGPMVSYHELKAQRDELLAALEAEVEVFKACGSRPLTQTVAAITKAKGSAS